MEPSNLSIFIVFLGMSLGVLWIPCVGSILGAVLALVASAGDMTYGASMLFVYSIGMSLPLFSQYDLNS